MVKSLWRSDASFFINKITSYHKRSVPGSLCNRDAVKAAVAALLYEPCNMRQSPEPKTYMHGPPSTLPLYLESFTPASECMVVEGPKLQTCVCTGEEQHYHLFMEIEGFSLCSVCESTVCHLCQHDLKEETDVKCLACFRDSCTGANDESDYPSEAIMHQ